MDNTLIKKLVLSIELLGSHTYKLFSGWNFLAVPMESPTRRSLAVVIDRPHVMFLRSTRLGVQLDPLGGFA